MRSILTVGKKPYIIMADIVIMQKDIIVCIGGGDTPHIGAVSLATPRNSLRKDGSISASASVLCVVGHKDDEFARAASLYLASLFNTNVLVTVGIHIDEATSNDLYRLQINFKEMIKKIKIYLDETIE
ncbi:MAG TPA: hypothetical protein IAB06_01375 [Candidatus Avacidaminococcus intestinavium]|uniref:Prenylated flavin chaperone LpdD-like domain-containing protein n=1 Tax=Candidatus Avacidaminococcus intestinavium TaxID=2840684 RepID=A0A9D1MP35_9FIRM|nr:hypothetical protein [Candidatus Avacidaminococcus intestinavium]